MRTNILLTAGVLLLASCASSPEATAVPGMTFAHLSPQALNVAMVDVIDRSGQRTSPDSFVINTGEALEKYLRRRFVAGGNHDTLRAVIEDAEVQHSYKKSPNKMGQFFEVAGIDEYNVKIKLRLEHDDGAPEPRYKNSMTVSRIIRVSEHASVAEREKRQMEGLEILFQDLDREANRIVNQDMKLGL